MQTQRRPWRAWQVAVLTGLATLGLLAALGAGGVWLALEPAPRLAPPPQPTAASMTQLRHWLRRHDPRRAPDGRRLVVRATATDLQLMAGEAARLLGGTAQLQLSSGRLQVQASLPLAGRWLNVDLGLADGPRLPTIARLQVGALALPGWLAQAALQTGLAVWDRPRDGSPPLHQMAEGVRFRPGIALLTYRWRADLPLRLATWLVPPAQMARLQVYQAALVSAVRRERGPQELPALLMPLFDLARQRSQTPDDDANAAAENRAALLVLAAHAGGRPLASLLPAAKAWPPVPRRGVLLAGRTDFPLHFLVSAALAAEGGGPLADALGLAKELGDARQGSGFSFNDIAVNRAGTRLGETAVADPLRVQAMLATGVSVQTLIPDVSDLPEFLSQRDFEARFGQVGSPVYQAMMDEIEARVARLPLLR